MIVGIGIDITEIKRLGRLLERQGDQLWERVLAPEERREFGSEKRRVEFLSGRWAAKEAASKAFGTGIGQIYFHDLVIHNDEAGAPHLTLKGNAIKAAAEKGINRVHLSISHSDEYAVAQVILESV
jgi:holo-[acyl-carrier protein] synthase